GGIEPQLTKPAPRVGRQCAVEQGQEPARDLGGDDVHRAAHRPGPKYGTLLGARSIDVRGGQPRTANPKAEPSCARILGLDAGAQPRHIRWMPDVRRPVEELSGGPKRRQAPRVDASAQESSSCE